MFFKKKETNTEPTVTENEAPELFQKTRSTNIDPEKLVEVLPALEWERESSVYSSFYASKVDENYIFLNKYEGYVSSSGDSSSTRFSLSVDGTTFMEGTAEQEPYLAMVFVQIEKKYNKQQEEKRNKVLDKIGILKKQGNE